MKALEMLKIPFVRLITGLRNHKNFAVIGVFDFNNFAQILQTSLIQIKFYKWRKKNYKGDARVD